MGLSWIDASKQGETTVLAVDDRFETIHSTGPCLPRLIGHATIALEYLGVCKSNLKMRRRVREKSSGIGGERRQTRKRTRSGW